MAFQGLVVAAEWWPRKLDLSFNQLTDDGIADLCEGFEDLKSLSPVFWNVKSPLTMLSLAHNKVGPRGAEVLACSSLAKNLNSLDISENSIRWYDRVGEDWTGTVQGFDWPKLESLVLRDTNINDEQIQRELTSEFGARVHL